MAEVYESIADAILKKEYHLDWFVKEVFPPEELDEFLSTFKYTMLVSCHT
jgi:hypothetical protein